MDKGGKRGKEGTMAPRGALTY